MSRTAHLRSLCEAWRALEAFADIDGEGVEDYPDETKATVTIGRMTDYTLTLGDFRRARTAFQSAEAAVLKSPGQGDGRE